MKKKMETFIIGYILELCGDNGKENGSHYLGFKGLKVQGLISRQELARTYLHFTIDNVDP